MPVAQMQFVETPLLIERGFHLETQRPETGRQIRQFSSIPEDPASHCLMGLGPRHAAEEIQELAHHAVSIVAATEVLETLLKLQQVLEFPDQFVPVQSDAGFRTDNTDPVRRSAEKISGQIPLLLEICLRLSLLDPEQRGLGDIDMTVMDELRHLPKEKRQQQSSDMASVHIRIRHNDDPMIPELGQVEIGAAHACTDSRNHGDDFLVAQHFVESGFFDIEDLALDRKNRLKSPVPTLLRGPSRRIPFDDEDL